MSDIDPHDYIDMYTVEIKPSVFSDTPLTQDDFHEKQQSIIYSHRFENGELQVEFPTKQGAEKLVTEWNQELDFLQSGKLNLHLPHPTDEADIDAYLLFTPRS